jgi:hypothetical protein
MKRVSSFNVFGEPFRFRNGSVDKDETAFFQGPIWIQNDKAEPRHVVHHQCRVKASDSFDYVVVETRHNIHGFVGYGMNEVDDDDVLMIVVAGGISVRFDVVSMAFDVFQNRRKTGRQNVKVDVVGKKLIGMDTNKEK